MNEKIIPILIALMLFIGSIFLSFIGKDKISSLSSESNWEVYFTNPSEKNISFNIKNKGKNGFFSWQIESENKIIITNGKEEIKGGEIRIISPEISQEFLEKKIIVETVDENGNKESIYKILNK